MKRIAAHLIFAAAVLVGGCSQDAEESPYNEESGNIGPAAAADSAPYPAPAPVDTQTAPAVVQP